MSRVTTNGANGRDRDQEVKVRRTYDEENGRPTWAEPMDDLHRRKTLASGRRRQSVAYKVSRSRSQDHNERRGRC